MNKSLWRNVNITLLLIINGNECEVEIPIRDDIIVWKRDYNGEYDIGSYKLGIEMPITNAVNDLIEKNRSVDEIIDNLLSRPIKKEK